MPTYRVTFKKGPDGYTPPALTITAPTAQAARSQAIQRMRGGSTPNPQVDDVTTQASGYSRPSAPSSRVRNPLKGARCESGWTGDRCTKPLGHKGPHSNE